LSRFAGNSKSYLPSWWFRPDDQAWVLGVIGETEERAAG
jgi:hypothetical protein